jgi:hypothetical protein
MQQALTKTKSPPNAKNKKPYLKKQSQFFKKSNAHKVI